MMKFTLPFLPIFLCFLHFVFSTAQSDEVVLDADGNFLLNGDTYLLSPPESYGGYTIKGKPIYGSHALYGVVAALYARGWPVIISAKSVVPTGANITTNYALTLSFPNLSPYGNWTVDKDNSILVNDYVSDDYVKGDFFIKPYDVIKKQYNLVFCYRLGGARARDDGGCGNVGVLQESHNDGYEYSFKRLVVTDKKPLVFTFKKVESGISMVV